MIVKLDISGRTNGKGSLGYQSEMIYFELLLATFEASIAKLEKQQNAAQAAGKTSDVTKFETAIVQAQSLLDAARSGASTLG